MTKTKNKMITTILKKYRKTFQTKKQTNYRKHIKNHIQQMPKPKQMTNTLF